MDKEKNRLVGGGSKGKGTVVQVPGAGSTRLSVRGSEPGIWEMTLEDPERPMEWLYLVGVYVSYAV